MTCLHKTIVLDKNKRTGNDRLEKKMKPHRPILLRFSTLSAVAIALALTARLCSFPDEVASVTADNRRRGRLPGPVHLSSYPIPRKAVYLPPDQLGVLKWSDDS